MAVTMADISHLRKMSGAGMMDCKKALEEAGNDFDKAMEIIRKKGIKLERYHISDREAGGEGQRLGICYQLADGEVVYVPESE